MREITMLHDQDSGEADRLYRNEYRELTSRTDKLIVWIMGLQWGGAIIASLAIFACHDCTLMERHPNFITACIVGGLLTLTPIYFALTAPTRETTRHLIAACQMLMSGLLIHITGGRIETHFHVFGSLALLSLYLDWEILVTATVATFVDHVYMGFFMPACLFGTSTASHWRIVEHVLWVVFFDVFLIIACVQSQRRLKVVAGREADQVYQAFHDALTGLGNRLLLDRLMKELTLKGTSYTFMLLDLDRFKEVNDTVGHHLGDAVLVLASDRMKAELRAGDRLIRMGGDEFAVLLADCAGSSISEDIAERIITSLNRPFQCDEHTIHIGVSIGICHNEGAALGSKEMFHNADLSLYKVKNTGRNRYIVFDSELEAQTLHDMSLEHRLRDAVLAQSLHLHYQPIVSNKGILLGFEALLRWQDEVHGAVPPSEFIAMAERTGLIVPLGAWVIRRACKQAAEWQAAGNKAVKMSVNVSSIQLNSPEFVGTVLQALQDSGLAACMLDLELTESMLIQRHDGSLRALELLHDFGVRLSIDDFGTGYSSLSYLRDLPVDTIKIDRAFVRDIVNSVESRLLIEAMINMAHTLKLRVVAEGVETRDQLDVLVGAGCDEIQGFHVSCAVSSEDAMQFLHHDGASKLQHSRRAKVMQIPVTLGA